MAEEATGNGLFEEWPVVGWDQSFTLVFTNSLQTVEELTLEMTNRAMRTCAHAAYIPFYFLWKP